MRVVVGIVVAAGCGRIGFEPRPDSSAMMMPVPGLVAWYPLDDPDGAVVRDATGNGHDASCTACPTIAPGRTGGTARHFDGSSQYYEAAAAADLDFGRYTLAAWVEPERIPAPGMYNAVLSRPFGTGTADSYEIDIQTPGVAGFYTQPDDNLTGTAMVTVGQWFHLAATYDGTSKRIYFNGVLDAEDAAAAPTYDDNPLVLGADPTSGAVPFVILGTLADIRVYDRALSPAEIATLATP